MKNIKKIIINIITLIAALGLSACAAHSVSTSPEYMNSAEYQQRPTIKKSLLIGSTTPSDQDVHKLLSSKLVLPKKAKLAIIKLKSENQNLDSWNRWRSASFNTKTFTLDEELINNFINSLKKSPNFAEIIVLPNLLIGDEANFNSYRIAALRAQAEMILIIRPESFIDYRFNFFEANEAKSLATVESILVDTRTGLIPFTSIISELYVEKKTPDDYGMEETMKRAKQLAEGKALKKTAEDLNKFLVK